jgi:undecaprenyl-diphosphatase
MDDLLYRHLRTRWHNSTLDRAVISYTRLGEHGGLWFALSGLGALIWPGRRPDFVRSARTIALTYALNQAIKFVVRRRRPRLEGFAPLVKTGSQMSYPSAHASTSLAGARSLSAALPAPPLYAAAALMCFSRPYVGVHYPSDVVAGAALGAAVAELCP